MIKETDYAYIAGLFDGEGTVLISNQLYMAARLRNTNRAVLEWIKSINGSGHIYCDNRNAKPCYSLEYTSRQAVRFLSPLLPFLRIKRAQADLAIEFHQDNTTQGRPLSNEQKLKRQAHYYSMHQLNQG